MRFKLMLPSVLYSDGLAGMNLSSAKPNPSLSLKLGFLVGQRILKRPFSPNVFSIITEAAFNECDVTKIYVSLTFKSGLEGHFESLTGTHSTNGGIYGF